LRLDFLDGIGEAAVTIMSILVSCCSSSPDCSTHVGRMFVDPVGESFTDPPSLWGLVESTFGQLLRSAFDMPGRKIRSSRVFNEPKTDGGVR